jgi:hypothetical protein
MMHATHFGESIGRIIEAYVDDIVVKLKKTGDLVPDLTKVFAKLQQHKVNLNPEKCLSGFQGACSSAFVVSERSIKANLDKISAIIDTGPIKNLKGVQWVTGFLAALSRFSTTRRVQPATVQVDEEIRPLHVDARGARGTRFSQEYPQESTEIDRSDYRRVDAPVHLSDNPSGQRSFVGQARRAREVPKGAKTSVLRQQGTFRLQDTLLTDAETCVRDLDDQVQASTLL